MNDSTVRRITGIAALAIFLASVLTVPLYFAYPGPPPIWAVLTRGLLGLVSFSLLPVFFVGLSHLIRRADSAYDFIASLASGVGLTFTAVLLVGLSMEVGGVLGAPDRTVDPTIHGPLATGSMLIHGSIGRGLTVVYLTAAGYGASRTGALPAWFGRFAYVIAAINLVFVPSLFFGTEAARFYSAIGWGNSAVVAGLIGIWVAAAGTSLLRRPVARAA
jgi:hypothetical protein